MIIQYEYIVPDDCIQEALKVDYKIYSIVFEIDFKVLAGKPGSWYAPMEPDELDVARQEMLYLYDSEGVRVDLTKEQKFIIGDYIVYEYLDQACYDAWKKVRKAHD